MIKKDIISMQNIKEGRKALMGGDKERSGLIITGGKGARIWDHQGKEYIDCTSQAYCLNVGAQHPKIVEAAKNQVEKLSHAAYFHDSIPLLMLSKKMAEIAPSDLNKVNYCLEGSLAVEGAMKLAMLNNPGKRNFIALEHGFHGRSLPTIAASWVDPRGLFPFYIENIIKVPEAYCYRCAFGLEYPSCGLQCTDYIEHVIQNQAPGVAALIMEPVQGNGGQISFPVEFHQKVREICTKHGVLLIWDEVQTSFGRTGEMFASNLYNVIPDILVFGKAAGGGYPMAGILAKSSLKSFGPMEHGFTFSHFPVSLTATLKCIEIIEEENLLENCRNLNSYIMEQLEELKKIYEMIGDIRGPGLAIGVELVKDRNSKTPAKKELQSVLESGMSKGVFFGRDKYMGLGNTLKIKPPLTIKKSEVDKVLSVFEESLKELYAR